MLKRKSFKLLCYDNFNDIIYFSHTSALIFAAIIVFYGVMVIVVGIEHDDTSSNPGRD